MDISACYPIVSFVTFYPIKMPKIKPKDNCCYTNYTTQKIGKIQHRFAQYVVSLGSSPVNGPIYISCKEAFILKYYSTYRLVHIMAFVIPVVEHWLECEA